MLSQSLTFQGSFRCSFCVSSMLFSASFKLTFLAWFLLRPSFVEELYFSYQADKAIPHASALPIPSVMALCPLHLFYRYKVHGYATRECHSSFRHQSNPNLSFFLFFQLFPTFFCSLPTISGNLSTSVLTLSPAIRKSHRLYFFPQSDFPAFSVAR